MSTPDDDVVSEAHRLLDAATPGPWGWADGGSFGGYWLSHRGDPAEPYIAATQGPDIRVVGDSPNMDLIAAAPRLVAGLLARIEELEAQREAVLGIHVMQEYHSSSEDYAGSWECYSCGEDWPCATVTALTPELS